eukprot:TRINITY_DN8486_c0_g1_i1.p3 TRINITY_DN8486_c0_g1~~TRINITY_DN8486_c0_g1_i1.p3  ORF type:complete len:140 (+),score=12.91 TRINITY_DN8486_c0_g1_i1:1317-1736(+)
MQLTHRNVKKIKYAPCPRNLQSIIKVLTRTFKFKCDYAYYGAQCIEKMEKRTKELEKCDNCSERKPYKLIIMPFMNGIQAIKLLREMMNWEASRSSHYSLTAFAFQNEYDKCIQTGVDDYMTKPVDSGILRQKIQKWIQ